jgi:hypothetical protein
MADGALPTLVRLELGRIFLPVVKMYGFTAAVAALLLAAGWSTPGRLSFLLALAGFSTLSQIPMNALRDRIEGGLEFLKGLPVDAGTLALARVAACAVGAVPAAVIVLGAAVVLGRGTDPVVEGTAWIPGAVILAWAGLAAGASLVTGLVLRVQVSRIGYVPLVLVLALAALDPVVDRLVPDPAATVGSLLELPWLPQAAWAAGLAASGLVTSLAFQLARSGIRTFTPGRDRVTW